MPNFAVHSRETEYSERFPVLLRYREESTLIDLDDGENPLDVMRAQVRSVVDRAIENAEERGIQPTKIGFTMNAEGLENPLYVPFRSLEQNSVDALMNTWEQIEQSHRELNVYRTRIEFAATVYGTRRAGLGNDPMAHKEDEFGVFHIFSPDGACLFRAAEVARVFVLTDLTSKKQRSYLRQNPNRVDKLLGELRCDFKYPNGSASYDLMHFLPLLEAFYNKKYGRLQNDRGEIVLRRIRISVFQSRTDYKPLYQGKTNNPTHELLLYYHDAHCDVIVSLRKFFGVQKVFCIDCCSPFTNALTHQVKCKRRCNYCFRMGIDRPCQKEYDEDGKWIKYPCEKCNKTFPNLDCFQSHVERDICGLYHICIKCGKCYNAKRGEHNCGEQLCFTCKTVHAEDECYITTVKPMKSTVPSRIVCYDFETRQEDLLSNCALKHEVNYVAAYSSCTKCLDNGEWKTDGFRTCCATYKRMNSWNEATGCDEPLRKFVSWLLKLSNEKNVRLYAIAHFAARFDLILIIGELVRQNIDMKKFVANGNKVFQVVVKHRNGGMLIFKDSYLLFPLALSALPQTFNLGVEEKQWFPYLWNKRCNYNNPLPHLPPMEYYSTDCMTTEKYAKFLKYYEEEFNTPFDLKVQLEEYGRNDVNILMHAVVEFRKIFLHETSIDMIQNATTIASACMLHFRTNILKEKTIAVVPETGYEQQTRQSSIALKYIKWYAHCNPQFTVRHRDSAGGEIKYKQYSLDAVVDRGTNEKPLVLEINGCLFHGHSACYEETDVLPNGRTVMANQKREKQRLETLSQVYEVRVVWTCEIERQLKKDTQMRSFFSECFDEGPIAPRNAFFGGRCGPVQMYAKADENTEIVFYDIQSMYPYQQFTAEFPLHHPMVVVKEEDLRSRPWTKPDDIPYKGLIKCVVLPPQRLRLPVLPMRIGDFLVFALCRSCAYEQTKNPNKEKARNCRHTVHQRSFVFEGTTFELAEALANSYQVIRFFRAWHYNEWSTELFKPYVRQFLKAKMESKKCKYDNPAQRSSFEREIFEHLQIEINTADMKNNPGRRTVSKLCLNSHWGRFGIRNRMSQTDVTTDVAKVINIFQDPTVEVDRCEFLTEKCVLIVFTKRAEYVKAGPASNLVYAALTTSCARIQLYRIMKAIDETPGFSLIYTDTDSVILTKPRNVTLPFEVGDRLGMMEKEMPDKEILEVVIAGNKQYAMMCRSLIDSSIVTTPIKIRGITFDKEVASMLTYEEFKRIALNYDDNTGVQCTYRKIMPDKRGTVVTKQVPRSYRRFYSKGVIDDDLKVYPFGYQFDRN